MSAGATASSSAADTAALRACLERQVGPRLTGVRCRVVEIQRAPAPAASSYASFVVSARLFDGRVLRVFMKDYGVSMRPRRDLRARRERELRVYRELLPRAGLDTARHLGAVWDEGAGRHWLLLELVEGPVLRELALDEHWIAALAWLGRLHARFAGAWDRAAPPPFLERLDRHGLSAKADRALAVVTYRAPALGRRMRIIRERFERLLPLLTAGPRTLLHGAFVPANIIVAHGDPPRLCPVDWELAAVGSPFYDLACFCDGFESPALDEMLAAYRRGAGAGGLALPPDDDVLRRIDGFRLHRVMDWLDQALHKQYPDEAIDALVRRGETLSVAGVGIDRPFAPDRAATPRSARERLGEVLAHAIGDNVGIASVRRRPNRFATLAATHLLELELTSGGTLTVFVKRLGGAQLGHPDKRRRDRELVLYRDLLSDPGLPVPRLLGIGREPVSGSAELYLEYIDGLDLRYCGLACWHVAVARLAALHRRFAQRAEVMGAPEALLALDETYFAAWAERAVTEVAQLYPDVATSLARVVTPPEPATALLAAQPLTLVHNDLAPKNVVAATNSERVAIIDWELAGLGCGVLDLVHLAHGLAPREHRRLCDAYWRALDGSPLAVDDAGERDALIAACTLHKTVYRLAHARALARDEATVRRWVDEAAGCRSRL